MDGNGRRRPMDPEMVLKLVRHYQRDLEKDGQDERRIIRCIEKLYQLPVTIQLLQDTGVGKTVNALRKHEGEVSTASRALVAKWKRMVAEEEEELNQETEDPAVDEPDSPKPDDRINNAYSRCRSSSDDQRHDVATSRSNHHRHESDRTDSDRHKPTKSFNINVKLNNHETETEHVDVYKSEEDDGDDSDDEEINHSSDQNQNHASDSEENDSDDYHKKKGKHRVESRDTTDADSDVEQHSNSSPGKSPPKSEKKHRKDNKSSHHSSKSSTSHKKDSSRDRSSSKHATKHSESSKHKSSAKKSNDSVYKPIDFLSIASNQDNDESDENKSGKNKDRDKERQKTKDSHMKHDSGREKSNGTGNKHSSKDKHTSSISSSSSKHRDSGNKHRPNEESDSKKIKLNSSSDKHKSADSSSSDHKKHQNDKLSRHDSESRKRDHKGEYKKENSTSHVKTEKKSKHKEQPAEYVPESKRKKNHENYEDGIDGESGASFAEALGMISPSKSSQNQKKKSSTSKQSQPDPEIERSDNPNESMPALLKSSAKLAPLPPLKVTVSALPEISPNYVPRPAPRLIEHHAPSITEDEAMKVVMNNKNQRTKVFSGNKTIGGTIPTLYELCIFVLQENISALEYTGGVPYDIIKPVVDKATPDQLFVLEHYNPYLIEDTDPLWEMHCKKKFRNKERQEMESWREMFMRCVDEQEAKLRSLTANIKIMQDKSQPVRQTKMAYVDSIVKPPRAIARKQAIFGTARKPVASPAARVPSLANDTVFNASTAVGVGAASSSSRPTSGFIKPKKAPLMQKALQFMKGRTKR